MRVENTTTVPSEGTVPTEIREVMPFGKWFQNFYNNISPLNDVDWIIINNDDIDDN